jgi:hypothetical protein
MGLLLGQTIGFSGRRLSDEGWAAVLIILRQKVRELRRQVRRKRDVQRIALHRRQLYEHRPVGTWQDLLDSRHAFGVHNASPPSGAVSLLLGPDGHNGGKSLQARQD